MPRVLVLSWEFPLIVCSHYMRQELIRTFACPEDKLDVIYNGIRWQGRTAARASWLIKTCNGFSAWPLVPSFPASMTPLALWPWRVLQLGCRWWYLMLADCQKLFAMAIQVLSPGPIILTL